MALTDSGPNPYTLDIEDATVANENFRTTAWTGEHLQLTLMAIPVGGEIGGEVHPDHDQFIRIEQGTGRVEMGASEAEISFTDEVTDDWAILIPAGKWHNVTNTGEEPLKLYSLYGPPDHVAGAVHPTKADADSDPNEH